MIKPDRPPYCDAWQIGVFWKYFLIAGLLFVSERVLREIRSRHRTYISKVIRPSSLLPSCLHSLMRDYRAEHAGGVVEVQIKKERTTTKAGQYIFINCPDVSYWQWHPFTLTSAPEEDFISVNIKMVGDWTKAFGGALGCIEGPGAVKEKVVKERRENEILDDAPMKTVLPRIMVDGPFGSASE